MTNHTLLTCISLVSHSQSVYCCEKQRRATPVAWMDYVSDNLIEKKHHLFFLHLAASIAGVSNNPQDEEEDVQDVKVEMEDCKDVIIWTQ